MPIYLFLWNQEIADHLAEHDVTEDQFESIVQDPDSTGTSRSTSRELAFGYDEEGRYLCCVFEFLDETTVIPITAYEVEE